jgi:hypothetical protein
MIFNIKPYQPPKKILNEFCDFFPDALNIEWNKTNDGFEALFHDDQIEKIACFNSNGHLLETRTNLNPLDLPGQIFKIANKYGELMNAIFIEKNTGNIFEIIIRMDDLSRMLILISEKNEILKQEKL